MAYEYLQPDILKDALHDSEVYMKEFWQPLAELERLAKGKPGKVPEGKPRVTDGTLAGIKRERPKQIIQQQPSGRVFIKGDDVMEQYANAILTDVILANANSGGTPFAKSKLAIASTFDVGAAIAVCFYNRRGSMFFADYKLKPVRDLLFEKGKTSEFDSNIQMFNEWYTLMDLKAIMWTQQQQQKSKKEAKEVYEPEWDLDALQELIDSGAAEKDEDAKSNSEKRQYTERGGYFRVVYFYQIGVSAKYYGYSPKLGKVVRTCTNKDPRGIIPVHILVAEEDGINPLGEPLAAISAGKQNLLDFDMQMYQYGQGMAYDPALKQWGSTPKKEIKNAPGKIIKMNGTQATDDVVPLNLSNEAIRNYANNASYIKTQMYNEQGGTNDSSVPASAGAVGFSKTPQGVAQQQGRQSASNNDIRLTYELWQGRIYETLLNIHFAESRGQKEVDLEPATLKRLKLDKSPVIDYEKEYGPIKFKVTAGTSRKLSDEEQAANMQQAQALMTPQNIYYLAQNGWKLDIGEYNFNLLTRMNIDSLDKILTKMDDKEAAEAKKQPFPIIDQPQIRINTADLTSDEIVGVLRNAGVDMPPRAPDQPGQPPAGLSPQGLADFQVEMLKAQADSALKQAQAHAALQPQEQPQQTPPPPKTLGESVTWKPGDLKPSERAQALQQVGIQADMSPEPTPNDLTQAADTVLKVNKHAHDTTMAVENNVHSQLQDQVANEQANRHDDLAETLAQKQADGKVAEANNG